MQAFAVGGLFKDCFLVSVAKCTLKSYFQVYVGRSWIGAKLKKKKKKQKAQEDLSFFRSNPARVRSLKVSCIAEQHCRLGF